MTDITPRDNRKHIDVRFPERLHARLQQWADERGITLSAAILTITVDRLNGDEVKR